MSKSKKSVPSPRYSNRPFSSKFFMDHPYRPAALSQFYYPKEREELNANEVKIVQQRKYVLKTETKRLKRNYLMSPLAKELNPEDISDKDNILDVIMEEEDYLVSDMEDELNAGVGLDTDGDRDVNMNILNSKSSATRLEIFVNRS